MSKTKSTSRSSIPNLKVAGVHVRSREEHWAELLVAVESTHAALNEGQFDPDCVFLPQPRITPVYRDVDGRRVTMTGTATGRQSAAYAQAPPLDIVKTGGVAGGFLSLKDAPPLPIAGGGSAAAWTDGYMSRTPDHIDCNKRKSEWDIATGRFRDSIARRTSPELDEWQRSYFQGVRETAEARNQVCRSPGAEAKGARFYETEEAWNREEYHQSLFARFAQAAEEDRKNTAEARTAAPTDMFDHSAQSKMLGLAGYLGKNSPGIGSSFYQAFQADGAERIGPALMARVREQARAGGGGGGQLDKLRAVFAMLGKLNQAGGGELLDNLAKSIFGKDGGAGGDPLEQLRGECAKNLANSGANPGLAQLLGTDAAGLVADAGSDGRFSGIAGDTIMNEQPGLVGGADKLINDLPNKLVDKAFDKLLGQVNDRSSMGRQLLAKYKDKIKDLLKKLLSPDGLDDLQKQWDAIWNGVPSSACVPLGLAEPIDGTDMVYVNGLPATRIGDICKWPEVPDAGPFFQGNPTIRINGMPPSGQIHAAKGAKGTIGTPLLLSPNVLMGEATVTVKIEVKVNQPQEQTSANGGAGQAPNNQKTPANGSDAGQTSYDDRTAAGTDRESARSPDNPCLTQIDTKNVPGVGDVPVYYDPTLSARTRGQSVVINGKPCILVGPGAEVPAGSTDAIQGPDGKYYNPCVVEHEAQHSADRAADWRDNRKIDGIGQSGESEQRATARGAQCAEAKGYDSYARDQKAKNVWLELKRRLGRDINKEYGHAPPRDIPPACSEEKGQK